jgi:hypothetical protein
MTIHSLSMLASVLTTLVVPAAAGAGDSADELNCTVEAKRSYRLAEASKPRRRRAPSTEPCATW